MEVPKPVLSKDTTSEHTICFSDAVPSDLDSVDSSETQMVITDGGWQAWVQVSCSFVVNFVVIGTMNCFGLFLKNYRDAHLDTLWHVNTTSLAFIGSLATACISLFGLFTGNLADRLGYRLISFTGALTYILALVLASYSTSYVHLVLTQGIMLGLAASLNFFPAMAILSHYFSKRKGLATGIAIAGAGIGGFVMSPVTSALLQTYGWQSTLRVLGATGGLLLTLAASFFRPRSQPKPVSYNKIRHYIFDFRFVCLFLCNLFSSFGYFVPFFFISVYATRCGLPREQGALLLGIMNASSGVGRVLMGMVADKFGHSRTLSVSLILGAVSMGLVWPFSTNYPSLIAFSVLYGNFAGGYASLFPTSIVQAFGTNDIATITGLAYFGAFFGNISGPTLVQYLLNALNDNYIPSMLVAAGTMLIGGLLVLAVREKPKSVDE